MYEIKINKESVLNQENTKAEVFNNVNIFVGDPWHEPVGGKIRNVSVELKEKKKKNEGKAINTECCLKLRFLCLFFIL
jgi:hypothetical protein